MNTLEKTDLELAIIDLWNVSRIALSTHPTVAKRYDRLLYVKNELRRSRPELVKDLTGKKLWFAVCDTTMSLVPLL